MKRIQARKAEARRRLVKAAPALLGSIRKIQLTILDCYAGKLNESKCIATIDEIAAIAIADTK